MYRIIHEKPFNNSVISLLESSAITESEFKHSSYGKDYQLELSRTYINGMRNPDLVFELFGHFSLEPAHKVRTSMLNSVKSNMTEFKQCCKMALQLKSVTAEEWIKVMESPETPGDELCLYLLGRLYYRHSLVVNKYNIWCTVDTGLRTDTRQLFEWSCIKLLYLGNRTYGVLTPKRTVHTLAQPQHQQALNLTTTSSVNYARGYPRVRQFGRSHPTTRGRGRTQPTSMNCNQPYYTRGRYLNQIPRGINRGLISTRGSLPRLYTPPTTYWGGLDISNRRINASPARPARPVDVVATVPGYAYSSQQWTTRNWQNLPPQPQQRTVTSQQSMSPEVTSLLHSFNQRANQSATPADYVSNPPIIVLDDEVPSALPPSNAITSRNVADNHQQTTNLPTDVTELEKRIVPQVTHDDSDSTEELLNEFGGATDVPKPKPSSTLVENVITGRSGDYDTTGSKTTQIVEENNSMLHHNEHDKSVLNSPEKPEVDPALKEVSLDGNSVGENAGEIPEIKNENLMDCINPSDLTRNVKLKTETQEVVAKSEFIDYINQALLCKMEDTDMNVDINKTIKSEEVDCKDASRVKAKNDVDIENSEEQSSSFEIGKSTDYDEHAPEHPMDHTTVIASITKKSRKKSRKNRKVRKSPKPASNKCTPLDRNINATTKSLFDQLKAIKQEVKRESSVVEDTLKDLDIPELNVQQQPTSISKPSFGLNEHSELEQQDNIHSNVEREQKTDADVPTGNTELINTKTDKLDGSYHFASDGEHDPKSNEWQKPADTDQEAMEQTSVEGESELKTSYLQSKGKKRPQISSDSGESISDVDILLQPRKPKKQNIIDLPESDAELSTSATSESDIDIPSDSDTVSVVAGSSSSLTNNTDDDTPVPAKKKECTDYQTTTSATSESNSDNPEESSPIASTSTGTSTGTRKSSRIKKSTSKTKTGTRKFKCPKCGQTEFSVQALNNHYKGTHSKLSCKKCKKQFNTPSSLKKHEYIHLDKPFKCSLCDKRYPFKSQLSSHEITHTNQQDYKCNITRCNKTFKRKNEYDMHMRVHDGIEHKCNHHGCTYSNYDERNLVAHQKVHKPEIKRYICIYCGEKFLHYTQRSRHIQRECTKAPQES